MVIDFRRQIQEKKSMMGKWNRKVQEKEKVWLEWNKEIKRNIK